MSLPFGASASVFSFNKLALALLHIMTHKFLAIGTDFYDDYTLFEFQPAASLLDKVLMQLLSILGWAFAKEGRKFVPFSPSVISLGVSLDLKDIWTGVVAVGNKPGRLEKIADMLKAVTASDHTTKSQLASLHGLVNFAGGYTLGYQLKPTARMLALALSRANPGTSAELKSSCEVALTSIALARPRLCQSSLRPPIILHTDGAYEGRDVTWGAIVIDRSCQSRWVFSGRVPASLLRHWGNIAGEQLICQVEAYAVAIMLYALRGMLSGRSVLAFIDNDPCRFAFIKRFSPAPALMGLVTIVSILEAANETAVWYERVA